MQNTAYTDVMPTALTPSQPATPHSVFVEGFVKLFTDHPRSLGESYWAHLWATVKLAAHFLFATLVIIIHGLFPFLFMTTASSQIEKIYRKMQKRGNQNDTAM